MARIEPTDLVGLLYGVLLDPEGAWTSFLESLRDAVGGCQAALFVQGLNGSSSRMLSLGDPDRDRDYGEHYGAINPWFTRGRHLIRPGAVVTSEWLPAVVLRRTEFYADWLRPQDMFHAINGFIFEGCGLAGNISVAKPWSKDAPDAEDVRLFEFLMPHLQRVVEVQRRLAAPSPGTPLGETLDRVAAGLLFADLHGRLTFANHAGQRLLDRADALALGRGRALRAVQPASDVELRAAMRSAATTAKSGLGEAGSSILVQRREGSRPLAVTIAPIRGRLLAFAGEPVAVLIMVADPESSVCPNAVSLARLYRLTPRETELASQLALGHKLVDVAEEMGIGREAAHTHLSRVLQKTGTHRQSELVRLLLLGCPSDPDGDDKERFS